jgi:hypothetical protein
MFTVYSRYISGLYWNNERLERTTLNDLVATVFSARPSQGTQDGLVTRVYNLNDPNT